MDFIKVFALLIYWFPLGGIGYSCKGANGGREKIRVDKTCVDCRGEVLLIAELATAKDPVKVQ